MTKIVTLRQNHSLVKLSVHSKKSIDILTDRIIAVLIQYKIIYDSPEFCGETLKYVLEENDFNLEVFAVYCFHVSTPEIIKILEGIRIWGLSNDCENCGCAMEYNDMSEHKECINDVCGCSINMDNTPDSDMYRDDCNNEYFSLKHRSN